MMVTFDENLDGPFVLKPRHIVDAHVHVGRWPAFDLEFTIEDLECIMSQYSVEGAVVMPALVGDRVKANVDLLRLVHDDPRFYFFAWVGPTTTIAELEGYGPGLAGLKFHPSISQTSITEARMHSSLEFADRHRLPFLYHAGRTPISWPDRLMAVAPSYPKVKFIMAHAGGTAYDRAVDTLRRWPTLPENIWAEISTVRWPDLLTRMVETWGEDRVLYGSDLPFVDLRVSWYALELAGLASNESVMGGNLRQLLKAR